MALIIVDPKPTMRALGITGSSQINIDEVEWAIENSLTRNMDIYAIMQGQKSHLHEIVKLSPVQPYDKNHTIYKVYPDQKIRLNDEQVILRLLFLEHGKSAQRTSNTIAFIIETDNYELAHMTAIAQELGAAVEAYYNAIAYMYNEFKKGDIVDDNES